MLTSFSLYIQFFLGTTALLRTTNISIIPVGYPKFTLLSWIKTTVKWMNRFIPSSPVPENSIQLVKGPLPKTFLDECRWWCLRGIGNSCVMSRHKMFLYFDNCIQFLCCHHTPISRKVNTLKCNLNNSLRVNLSNFWSIQKAFHKQLIFISELTKLNLIIRLTLS